MDHKVLCFAPEELKILRQITGEAREFGAERLEPYGCTEGDVKELVVVLRQKPVPPAGVCFAFAEAGESVADDRRRLDPSVLRWWKPVAEMVIRGLSPRELRFRTGFDFEEISAAVERIPAP